MLNITKEQLQKIQKYKEIMRNPKLALYQLIQEFYSFLARFPEEISRQIKEEVRETIESYDFVKANVIEEIVGNLLRNMKGEKGDPGESIRGEKGDKPIAGIDYHIPKDGRDGKTPVPGRDYPTRKQIFQEIRRSASKISRPKEVKPPEKGLDYFTPADIKSIVGTIKKTIGIGEIRDEMKELKKMIAELKKSPMFKGRRVIHRGGIELADPSLLGTGDGANTAFTLPDTPYDSNSLKHLFVGGAAMFEDDDWTRSGKTITFLTAPPNGAKVRNPSYHKV